MLQYPVSGSFAVGKMASRLLQKSAKAPYVALEFGNGPHRHTSFPIHTQTLRFAGQQVKVMSYNTENFELSTKSPQSVAAVAEAILREKPDVIGLQEIRERQDLEQLNQQYLSGEYPNIILIPLANATSPFVHHVALMYKDTVKLVGQPETHQHETTRYANRYFTRDLLEATFETLDGHPFKIGVVHWKSMFPSENKTKHIRKREGRRTLRIITDQLKANPQLDYMLIGDFNTLHADQQKRHGQAILDRFQRAQLTELLETNGNIPPTNNGGTRFKPAKLDYCYVSPAMLPKIKQAYVCGDFKQWPWSEASDHLPLVSVFEAPDPPAKPVSNPVQFGTKQNVLPFQETHPSRLNQLA